MNLRGVKKSYPIMHHKENHQCFAKKRSITRK